MQEPGPAAPRPTAAESTTPVLRSSRAATISVQVYRHLRERIVAGGYVPLQSISENELAEAFGVSRTPVREALGKLEEEDLISILPRYGTFVAPIRVSRVASDQFVREALECAAVAEAASRCTERDAAALRDILQRQASARTDAAFFEADETMHRTLMALAGRAAAWHIVDAAKATLDRIRHLSVRQTVKRRAILAEHARIVARVIAGDGPGAVSAMREHLRGVFTSTEQAMQRHPEFFHEAPGEPRPARRKRTARQEAAAITPP
jgi:GntR family transcriptional regulator, rspAB operon transcriptional repressor